MPRYVNLDEYLTILKIAMPDEYDSGVWHPEDISSMLSFINEAVGRTLASIKDSEAT